MIIQQNIKFIFCVSLLIYTKLSFRHIWLLILIYRYLRKPLKKKWFLVQRNCHKNMFSYFMHINVTHEMSPKTPHRANIWYHNLQNTENINITSVRNILFKLMQKLSNMLKNINAIRYIFTSYVQQMTPKNYHNDLNDNEICLKLSEQTTLWVFYYFVSV